MDKKVIKSRGMYQPPVEAYESFIAKYNEPQHHLRALLNASIVTLDLNITFLYPLANAGVRTVRDLLRLYRDPKKMMNVRRIGEGTVAAVGRVLANAGLIGIAPDLHLHE